jgi:hypothetical protein
MKWLVLGLLISISSQAAPSAATQTNDSGKEAAQQICASLSFSDEKTECLKQVTAGGTYQKEAVEVCKTLSFPDSKKTCLETISNKTYTATALGICKQNSFSDAIVQCLKSAGQETKPPTVETQPVTGEDLEEVTSVKLGIRKAIDQINKGNYGKAKVLLGKALEKLD